MVNFKILLLLLILIPFSSGAVNIIDTATNPVNQDTLQGVKILTPEGILNINITNIFNNITINGTDLHLNNLTDVDVPSPSDGDSLVWDNSLMKWVAEFVISRWNIDLSNGYLYNNSDTLFFNETKLNNTIDARAGSLDNDFHIFINGSSYNNINHNITAGDADTVEFTIIPGKKFIFGDTFT